MSPVGWLSRGRSETWGASVVFIFVFSASSSLASAGFSWADMACSFEQERLDGAASLTVGAETMMHGFGFHCKYLHTVID